MSACIAVVEWQTSEKVARTFDANGTNVATSAGEVSFYFNVSFGCRGGSASLSGCGARCEEGSTDEERGEGCPRAEVSGEACGHDCSDFGEGCGCGLTGLVENRATVSMCEHAGTCIELSPASNPRDRPGLTLKSGQRLASRTSACRVSAGCSYPAAAARLAPVDDPVSPRRGSYGGCAHRAQRVPAPRAGVTDVAAPS